MENPKIIDMRLYPVKGLRGIKRTHHQVIANEGLKGDREYAILKREEMKLNSKGHASKVNFLQGMQHDGLANFGLDQNIDLDRDLSLLLQEILPDIQNRMGEQDMNFTVQKGMYTDDADQLISMQNLTTLTAFSDYIFQKTGQMIEGLNELDHWRANILINHGKIGSEYQLGIGEKINISGVLCEVVEPIGRCNQINKSAFTGLPLGIDMLENLYEFAKIYNLNLDEEQAYMGVFLRPLESGIIYTSMKGG